MTSYIFLGCLCLIDIGNIKLKNFIDAVDMQWWIDIIRDVCRM